MKKPTEVAEKECQGLDEVDEFDKKEGDEAINKDDRKPTLKKYNKSDLTYDANPKR